MSKQGMPHKVGEEYVGFKLFYGCFIPDWVDRLEISSSAKRLMGRLYRYQGKDGLCYPSLGRLADDLRLSRRQIQNLLNELENEGLVIRCPPSAQDKGRGKSTRYKFPWHPEIRADDLRGDVAGEEDFPRGKEMTFSGGRELGLQGVGQSVSHKEKHLREPDEETSTASNGWHQALDKKRDGRRGGGVFNLSVEQKEYVDLCVDNAVQEGKITTSEAGYRQSLIRKALRNELDMTNLDSLRIKAESRVVKAKRQAMKERQQRCLSENIKEVESYRLQCGVSVEEFCRVIFEGGEGVGGLEIGEVEQALLKLYPERACKAKSEKFRRIGAKSLANSKWGRGR